MIFIYILLALLATLAGSITGMGGGVIMKPVMDLLGHYSAATIGVLSGVAVFVMACVSVLRQIGKKQDVKAGKLIILGAASAVGGWLGQLIFSRIESGVANDAVIKIIQNIALSIIILVIFLYMLKRSKIKSLGLKHFAFYIAAGIFLGMTSSFLGIGGGPINVALLIFLFGLDIKSAVFASIITILFAQATKLTAILFTTGYSEFDLTVLPYMVAAAVTGALVGSAVKARVNARVISVCFNIMQIIILCICIANIIKYAIML